jgi:hypothetical protein
MLSILSKVLVTVCAGALIAGCGSVPQRTGKGNDHEIAHRSQGVESPRIVEQREVVYVERAPVYYQPIVPAYRVAPSEPGYRVVTSHPAYSTVTTRPVYQRTYNVVPVTRYYYVD